MEKNYEAIVIGSGFGGAITGCRMARKWDRGGVLILERGKRYPTVAQATTGTTGITPDAAL